MTALLGGLVSAVAAEDRVPPGGDKVPQSEYDIKDFPGVPPGKVAPPTFTFEKPRAVVNGMTYVGTAYIVNSYTHDGYAYCLDAHSGGLGAPNSPVGLWQCNGGPTLAWNIYTVGGSGPYNYRFINYQWNRSLDYPAASNGANLWRYGVYDYVDSRGQRFWPYARPETGNWEISVELGGALSMMDAYGTQAGNNTPVLNGPYSGHPRQRWVFCWLPDGVCG
ncbi:hypothetical protein ABZ897_41235 [Nonomuraea sp. NPDC046802]|uniref:RICIN domain-containing protein n=1 Tax=Nonomuraea sp. NPDC046802 TaxID=3154919 RepID=UPI0033FF0599